MKEIITLVDIQDGKELIKKGTVFKVGKIDKNGFAFCWDEMTGFFENEYELYVPDLENK